MARQFIGKVVVEWLENEGDDRKVRLLEPFAFEDEAGLRWDVPAGTDVDGASIPRAFWTTFGPPFVGDYRRASVVHDHYCVTRSRPWQDVHRMFHEGCLAGGVGTIRAKAMYLAVRNFGPRWAATRGPIVLPDGAAIPAGTTIEMRPEMSEDDYQALLNWIEAENPSLEQIDARSEPNVRVMPILPGFSPES